MSEPLIFALPSKGRLKEQAEAWLSDCGFNLQTAGGARGYRATIDRLPEVQVQLMSASDIATALDLGEAHLGVTGEDLLRERGEGVDQRVMLLRPLGFGRADVVVAAPKSWIDVDTMADVEDVAASYLARTGRRLRVATKYTVLTRTFFAGHGVADYRIVESSGATEGAPAAGAAELIVDITTTGATLAANNLKILSDGVILRSEAQLAAGLKAGWTREQTEVVRGFLRAVEARARAKTLATVAWGGQNGSAGGLLTPIGALFETAEDLASSGLGPATANRPDYVFQADCPAAEALQRALGL
ncbi:MAG TPA: ATP phosphoribosyltransferase [Caulobacteraceae bacterium]|nr:ATP phosphoribosyltransferase [Caulobacteraceae bacterium]